MLKKLMTKENLLVLGLGVVAFFGTRYVLRKRDEMEAIAFEKETESNAKSSADGGCGCGM